MITISHRLHPWRRRLRSFDPVMMEIANNLVNRLPPDVDPAQAVFNFAGSFDAIERLRGNENALEVVLEMSRGGACCPVINFARNVNAVAAMSMELDRLVRRSLRQRGRRTTGKYGFRRLA